MSLNSFIYRRLAPWITCEFKIAENLQIRLQNKYEIASFKDVFCHPFYWQVFQWVEKAPNLVVDCGAHCGHFSILADLCFRSKFGVSNTHYILIEPNPYLQQIIRKNIKDATIEHRSKLMQGLLGVKSGDGLLWVNSKNYLASGLHQTIGSKPYPVPYINLSEIVGSRTIDLLKIDIEGGEFDFVRGNLHLMRQVNLIFMEMHAGPEKIHLELLKELKSIGLSMAAEPLDYNGQKLIILNRNSAAK